MKMRGTVKVWVAAHVGSDGKVRPCPDNHPALRRIVAFACGCGGKNPVILSGEVSVTNPRASVVDRRSLNRAAVIGALR